MASVDTDAWLPGFFLRPKSLLSALRSVDFFRSGRPLVLCPVLSVDAALTWEYRSVADGFARCRGGDDPAAPGPDEGLAANGGAGGGSVGGSGTSLCRISTWLSETSAALSCDDCACCPSVGRASASFPSAGGGLATAVLPGRRMGNSSSDGGLGAANVVPGLRIGNSSSSVGLAIGIGPDILPRMDWRPEVLDRDGLEPDLKRLTFMMLPRCPSLLGDKAVEAHRGLD